MDFKTPEIFDDIIRVERNNINNNGLLSSVSDNESNTNYNDHNFFNSNYKKTVLSDKNQNLLEHHDSFDSTSSQRTPRKLPKIPQGN
jgi:hypothetical protein